MDKIIENNFVEKSIEILNEIYDSSPAHMRNSFNSIENLKIKNLAKIKNTNEVLFNALIDQISYGKLSNHDDYFEQEVFHNDGRTFVKIDFREAIFILALLLRIVGEEWLDESIYINDYFLMIKPYSVREEGKVLPVHDSWRTFNEKITQIKGMGNYENYLKLDIKNAFSSLNLNLIEEIFYEKFGKTIQTKSLFIILKRISPNGGLPLIWFLNIASHIIWSISFENIFKTAKISSEEIVSLSYVDDMYIFYNNDKRIALNISSTLKEYGLYLNEEKTIFGNVGDLTNKNTNLSNTDFGSIDDFDEAKPIIERKIEELLDIEIKYLTERNNLPHFNAPEIDRENDYKEFGNKNDLYLKTWNTFFFIKKYFTFDNELIKEKIEKIIMSFSSLIENYIDFVKEEELAQYLFLIDKKNHKNEEFNKFLFELNSVIVSSFSWIHNSNFSNYKIFNHIYKMHNDNSNIQIKSEINSQVQSYCVKADKFDMKFWNLSVYLLDIEKDFIYSKKNSIKIIAAYSYLTWIYYTYVKKEEIIEPVKSEKELVSYLKTILEDEINFAKIRNSNHMTHAPTSKKNKIVKEIEMEKNHDFSNLIKLILDSAE